jgi:DNA-binding LacI/PurR family transcriptional regulator
VDAVTGKRATAKDVACRVAVPTGYNGLRGAGRLRPETRRRTLMDALIVEQDTLAPMVYAVARLLGRRIPQDLAVVGYNYTAVSMSMFPRLTTVHVPPQTLADAVMDGLAAWWRDGEAPAHRMLPYELVQRASCPAENGHVSLPGDRP